MTVQSELPKLRKRHSRVGGMTLADFPEIAAELHPERNDGWLPSDFPAGGMRTPWWRCYQGHEFQMMVVSRTRNGQGCSPCWKAERAKTVRSLAERSPALAAEWHPDKNDCGPDEVPVGNNMLRAWWLCAEGHEWSALISMRYYTGRGCAICAQATPSAIEARLRERLSASRYGLKQKSTTGVALKERWPHGPAYRVDFLGRVPRTRQKVVVEYDGSHWHATPAKRASDIAKTHALLDAGYVVVRVRENALPHLPIEHPSLMQLSHRWSNRGSDLDPVVKDILSWLDSKDYRGAPLPNNHER